MLEILAITNTHDLWDKTIQFAENCSWRAGQYLAEMMRKNQFNDWERVFIVYDNNQIIGYCTFTEKDELLEKYDFSPFIGFIFVDENYRGRRISEVMITSVTDYAKVLGYNSVYIMSDEKGLYEKYGFKLLGHYRTIFNSTEQLFIKDISEQ